MLQSKQSAHRRFLQRLSFLVAFYLAQLDWDSFGWSKLRMDPWTAALMLFGLAGVLFEYVSGIKEIVEAERAITKFKDAFGDDFGQPSESLPIKRDTEEANT